MSGTKYEAQPSPSIWCCWNAMLMWMYRYMEILLQICMSLPMQLQKPRSCTRATVSVLWICILFSVMTMTFTSTNAYVSLTTDTYGRGRVLRSLDSGLTWDVIIESYINLNGVGFASAVSACVVGDNGTIMAFSSNTTTQLMNEIQITTNPDFLMTLPTHLAFGVHTYREIINSYRDTADALIQQVNDLGGSLNLSLIESYNSIVKYYDALTTISTTNGTIWTPSTPTFVYSEVIPPTDRDFRDVIFINPFIGIAIGTVGTIYRTVNGGITWNVVNSNIIRDLNEIKAVSNSSSDCISSTDSSCQLLLACGQVGIIIMSNDTGKTWQSLYSNTILNLNGIDALNLTNFIAVGNNGYVTRSNDGGKTWTLNRLDAYRQFTLLQVKYISPTVLLISGTSALILRSDDGGTTFTRLTFSSPTAGRLASMFISSTVGLIASRDFFLQTAFDFSGSGSTDIYRNWQVSSSGKLALNNIGAINAMQASVLHVSPDRLNLSFYTGSATYFNVTLTNIGTETLYVSSFSSSTPQIISSTNSTNYLGFTITPTSEGNVLELVWQSAGLTSGSHSATITFYTDSPTNSTTRLVKLLLTAPPAPENNDWISKYWYVLAISIGGAFILAFLCIRRRLRYIKQHNKRLKHLDERIRFWQCWFWTVEESLEDWSGSESESDENASERSISAYESNRHSRDYSENSMSTRDGHSSKFANSMARCSNTGDRRSFTAEHFETKEQDSSEDDDDSDSISDQDYNDGEFLRHLPHRISESKDPETLAMATRRSSIAVSTISNGSTAPQGLRARRSSVAVGLPIPVVAEPTVIPTTLVAPGPSASPPPPARSHTRHRSAFHGGAPIRHARHRSQYY